MRLFKFLSAIFAIVAGRSMNSKKERGSLTYGESDVNHTGRFTVHQPAIKVEVNKFLDGVSCGTRTVNGVRR